MFTTNKWNLILCSIYFKIYLFSDVTKIDILPGWGWISFLLFKVHKITEIKIKTFFSIKKTTIIFSEDISVEIGAYNPNQSEHTFSSLDSDPRSEFKANKEINRFCFAFSSERKWVFATNFWFSYPYICATQCWTLQAINYIWSNSWKCQRFTPIENLNSVPLL